jgi:protoheme IX farnesyltransferase
MSWVAAPGLGRRPVAQGAARGALMLHVAKPRIVALFALTVLVATLLAGPVGVALTAAIVASSALTVAGAAALNNYLERDLDARMARTRRRPTANGALAPRAALAAGLLATGGGVAAVWACGGPAAAAFAAGGAFYYVVVYTLLIKPHTVFSSLPGALAGVFPALIGWTAAGGGLSGRIVFVCALIAVWSPPHFWALSYVLADEYEASGIPTPPVALGERAATRLIFVSCGALVALSLAPSVAGLYPSAFLVTAVPAGVALLAVAGALALRRSRATALLLHKVSGPYLAALLLAMVIERVARP